MSSVIYEWQMYQFAHQGYNEKRAITILGYCSFIVEKF